MKKSLPQVATLCFLTLFVVSAKSTIAEDAWYAVTFDDLEITEGEIGELPTHRVINTRFAMCLRPRFILDNPGAVWAGTQVGMTNIHGFVNHLKLVNHRETTIVARAEKGTDVTGRMLLPNKDWSGMHEVRFRIAHELADDKNREIFLKTQRFWYTIFTDWRLAGTAWFRHRKLETELQLGIRPSATLPADRPFSSSNNLYLGTRAVSENLALDQLLGRPASQPQDVDPKTIKGITIKEFEWDKMQPENEPVLDPLASYVPFDQYAIFFSDFADYVSLIDEIEHSGAPFLRTVSESIEDDRTLSLYETQLCLSLDAATKILGGQLIDSMAITGADLYLRSGSDVAVLMETKSPEVLRAAIVAMQNEALKSVTGCQKSSGKISDLEWESVVSPRRHFSSFVTRTKNAVIVANSLPQIQRLADIQRGVTKPMASLGEFKHFRGRYQRSHEDETAFVMLTDASIRQWCSAADRIAATRRMYASAVIAEETARHMDELVEGVDQPKQLRSRYFVPGLNKLSLTADGVVDATYGALSFLTPVSELRPKLVTKSEADEYVKWRTEYERNWRKAFDPIGVRVSVSKEQLKMDLTVMPLIARSSYSSWFNFMRQTPFEPDRGERHDDSILHVAMGTALPLNFLLGVGFDHRFGGSMKAPVSFYCHDSPFWEEWFKTNDDTEYLFKNLTRMPAAVSVAVDAPVELEAGIRKSPNIKNNFDFQENKHRDVVWHRGVVTEEGQKRWGFFLGMNMSFCYVMLPDMLHISPNPDMIKAAIDRHLNRQTLVEKGEPVPQHKPEWVGRNFAIQIRPPAAMFQAFGLTQVDRQLRGKSWTNLQILNEWKSRYPDEDAVALHERIWNSKLTCPAGGSYVWNEEYQTYESTVLGHPATHRTPKTLNPVIWFESLKRGNFGLTFEENGLRARVEIER